MVQEKSITIKTGKELLMEVEQSGKPPEQIVSDLGLTQVSDESVIREVAAKIITDNPDQVKTYREGKESLMGWFVGQIMRETKGKANPQTTQSVLKDLLKE
jgi:aspartyl-tRNA(Asn)/glutamyl-tRNA(Gln) amidotransferase subunit B